MKAIPSRRKTPRWKCHAPFRYFPCPKRPYEHGTVWQLPEKEFKLYHYLCWKTWGFDKPEDAISLEQMRDGITDPKTGAVTQAGIGYPERTLKRLLANLERKGWIKRRRNGPRPTTYSVLNPFIFDLECGANNVAPLSVQADAM